MSENEEDKKEGKKPERYRFLKERVEKSWIARIIGFFEFLAFWR